MILRLLNTFSIRYSLRSYFVFVLAFAVLFGFWVAAQPIPIPLPRDLIENSDTYIPGHILRIKSRRMIRQAERFSLDSALKDGSTNPYLVRRASRQRRRVLLNNLGRFDITSLIDQQVVCEDRDEFLPKALKLLESDLPLRSNVTGARVLELLGDSRGLDRLADRFLAEVDPNSSGKQIDFAKWPFFLAKPDWLATRPEFVEELARRADELKLPAVALCVILESAGRPEYMNAHRLRQLHNPKASIYERIESAEYLLANLPTDNTFSTVLKMCKERCRNQSLEDSIYVRLLESLSKAAEENWKQHPHWRLDMRKLLLEFIEQSKPGPRLLRKNAIRIYCRYANKDELGDLSKFASNAPVGRTNLYAIEALFRLGLEGEARALVIPVVESGALGDDLLEEYCDAKGIAAIPLLKEMLSDPDELLRWLAAIRELAELNQSGSLSNSDWISYLFSLLDVVDDEKFEYRFTCMFVVIRELRRAGADPDSKLWSRLPESDRSTEFWWDDRVQRKWLIERINIDELIQWVNQTLEPKNRLVASGILKQIESDREFVSSDHHGSIWRFGMQALIDAGAMIEVDFGTDSISAFSEIGRLCTTDCTISAVRRTPKLDLQLVVDGRLYSFQDHMLTLSSHSVIAIFNTILADLDHQQRMFLFGGDGERKYVMLAKPSVVVELRDRFGFESESGVQLLPSRAP